MKKNKASIAIVLFLMFAMAISLVALPAATAQEATRVTYPYIGATPNPVGIGQEVLLHVGITQQLSIVGMGWEGLSVTITRPDGTTETLRDITTDSTGGTGRVYVPTMAGNYTLQTHFPEQITVAGVKTSPGTPTGTRMLSSSSEIITLVVLEEPVPYWPDLPLPTEYWTRPINAQLREWSPIAQSFFGGIPLDGRFEPGHTDTPMSGHILWTKPYTTGGLVGGVQYGEHAFECGDAYQGKYSSPGIIAGLLIFTHATGVRPLVYTAMDIRTGEVVWENTFLDNRSISQLQLFYWDSYNYHGVYAYIWVTIGTTWYAFDPFDLSHRITMENVPSGTTIIGDNGGIYRYSISTAQGTMRLWNMSARISMAGNFRGAGHNTYDAGGWDGTTAAQTRAYALNFTFPTGLPGSVRGVGLGDRVVGSSINQQRVITWAFSLEPGREGTLLYNSTWNAPAEWAAGNLTLRWAATSLAERAASIYVKETRTHYVISLETGRYLWGPTEPEHYLGIYETWELIAYGRLYTHGMQGIIHCYDVQTGELLWKYESADTLSENLWSNNWPIRIEFITDGKIFTRHSEHSPVDPKTRGAPYICIDAYTGEELWRLNIRGTDWGGHSTIGDSVIVGPNTYDMRVYAISKGPSATTVTASPKVSVHGNSVLVEGLVTDVSPGTKDSAITMRFPNGVPAVSDESMNEWMQYVYMQFPRPSDIVGVEIVISVLDPNNNYYEVGRTTADADGFFKLMFEPEVPGEYTVISSFEGSHSYYGSHAKTAIGVEEAPAPTPEATPPPATVADVYLVPGIIGIIVAIVVVGVVIVLMLRKR
jgi:outer membrane protein assembly factor BamB